MYNPVDDEQCWLMYPWARYTLFNKLWVAEQMGYKCGPGGVVIPETGCYIVRPIYNLDGMARGATKVFLEKGDCSTPPGYFWCEFFEGPHYSVDFKQVGQYQPSFIVDLFVQGFMTDKLGKFYKWVRLPEQQWEILAPPPFVYNQQVFVDYINIEYIGYNPIEIHLRRNPDFLNHNYNELLVVWESDKVLAPPRGQMQVFIESPELIDGDKRLGFYAR